jgi:dimethylargininase
MLIAITRDISSAFEDCALTHLPRVSIDLPRAKAQHDAYEWTLVEAGCTVRRLDSSPEMPDSVFVEDIAVVLDELAIVTRPGEETRRVETEGVVASLRRHGRTLREIRSPGTLDGGDVLVVGRSVFIGLSARTNQSGASQASKIFGSLGYEAQTVPVHGCLHLKSAVTALRPDTVLINREWVDGDVFAGFTCVEVDAREAHAANALSVGNVVIYSSAFPRTAEKLKQLGHRVRLVDVDELHKAEGAVTCCSLIFEM